jgi:ubiquinone/menaquinone biosynthesis C-methylase UbiE
LDWLNFDLGERWLDIGCGTGAFTQQIKERCAPSKMIGVDPSEVQLEFARARDGMENCIFQSADAMALPFENEQFDASTMALVLFFVPDPEKGLSEMIRVTKKDGMVSAYVWDILGGGFPAEPIQAGLRSMNYKYALPPSVDISKMNNLKGLWEAAGLKAIETKIIKVDRKFNDFEEFWEITSNSASIKSVVADMEKEELTELKTDVQEQLPVIADGSVQYSSWANAIQGIVA